MERNNRLFKSTFTYAAIRPPGIVMYSLSTFRRTPVRTDCTLISPSRAYVGVLWDAGGICGYARWYPRFKVRSKKDKTGILHSYSSRDFSFLLVCNTLLGFLRTSNNNNHNNNKKNNYVICPLVWFGLDDMRTLAFPPSNRMEIRSRGCVTCHSVYSVRQKEISPSVIYHSSFFLKKVLFQLTPS